MTSRNVDGGAQPEEASPGFQEAHAGHAGATDGGRCRIATDGWAKSGEIYNTCRTVAPPLIL